MDSGHHQSSSGPGGTGGCLMDWDWWSFFIGVGVGLGILYIGIMIGES